MKDNSNANAGPLRKRDDNAPAAYSPQESNPPLEDPRPQFQPNGHALRTRFDVWVALDLLAQRWHWLVLGMIICGGLFYLLGWYFVRPKYTATAQLLRYETPGKSEYFKITPISAETFAALIRSPDLLRNVGNQLMPPIPPETLTKLIKIDPEPDSDMVKVQLAARDPKQAVNMLNLYLQETVNYTRDLEAKQAGMLANAYLKNEVASMDKDLDELRRQFLKLPVVPQASNKLAQIGGRVGEVSTNLATSTRPSMIGFAKQAERLQTALAELNDLMLKYTELHPAVQAKREQVKELEAQVASASTNQDLAASSSLFGSLGGGSEAFNPELDLIHVKLRALEDGRVELSKRQREAELYAANPPGSVRVFAPADLKTTKANFRSFKIGLATIFGGLLGLGASIVLVLLVEFVDSRLKTVDDVERVTKLPVLTALGNLHEMGPQARAQWAFRTWTMLQGRLSPSANHGLVCGVTSSAAGEGRSTWISLLAEAASLTGFRVLTIATRPSPTHVESGDENPDEPPLEDHEMNASSNPSKALTTSVLSAPAQVAEQLTGPNSQPVVHIPLPGWVWNLERRKQWREALNHWRGIDNLVILVELPPASVPEAILLGSNLPNMIWLADSNAADAGETRAQLETLRHARCHLVGAVLNRQPGTPVRKRFPRWLGCFALLAALGLSTARAQDTNTAPPAIVPSTPYDTNAQSAPSFSIISPSQRAAWQRRLTLGPGDVLTFNLYGQPELARAEMAVGPDGRVSFLEAQDVLATGLTIDELRAKFDQELSKYRRAPRTIITPVAYKSKRYFMLGKVTTKGVFVLDRPLTVLEALARSHGLESALVDRNVMELTDFRRSFLARGGKRIPLNFEKLFQQGDLSQNIAVEPDDYIYFAPADVQEVYVVGEVRLPGPVAYTRDLTVVSAITARGGYTDRAFKMRVLVVRGSLSNPESYVVNTHSTLVGKGLDFKLLPNDIVYVNSRPFIKVEEAADLAATAFIQSVITSWVGTDVVRPFK